MTATARETLALLIMEQHGLNGWFFAIVPQMGTVTCRPKRRLITITEHAEENTSDDDFAKLIRMACEWAKDPKHVFHVDGEYKANCPDCAKSFYRREPPRVEHMCAQCRQPLRFQ